MRALAVSTTPRPNHDRKKETTMKLVVQGETYEFDEDRMSVAEARVIKKQAGMGVTQWATGLSEGDPDALVALVFLAKKRAGEAPKWSDFDDLDLVSDVTVEDEDDDEAADVPADEKPTAGKRPARKATSKTAG